MKAILGLDTHNDSGPIIDLFARIGFENCKVTLTHCLEGEHALELQPAGRATSVNGPDSSALPTEDRLGWNLLDEAHKTLYKYGVSSEEKVLRGNPATELIHEADSTEADLVGIASFTLGHLRSAMLGSMGRALTIGSHKSVLIAKHKTVLDKPFTAVLATDHSAYCNKAIDKLIKFNPMGIQRLIILSVLPTDDFLAFQRGYEVSPLEKGGHSYKEKLQSHNEHTAKKFRELHMEVESMVKEGYVADTVNDVMLETNADLLIVAAQGHGFIERLGIGSLSLHEAVAAKHSLLIMRLDKKEIGSDRKAQ